MDSNLVGIICWSIASVLWWCVVVAVKKNYKETIAKFENWRRNFLEIGSGVVLGIMAGYIFGYVLMYMEK